MLEFQTVQLHVGYPACAGIDLSPGLNIDSLKRLPRMRGDRPGMAPKGTSTLSATPHARGSTPVGPNKVTILPGYPACAGIDLWPAIVYDMSEWLPRMRGDRPSQEWVLGSLGKATPHARGSTCRMLDRLWGGPGYPACAGIDLLIRKGYFPEKRLPRMRGDRPRVKSKWLPLREATPHARGSTAGRSRRW